MELVRLPLPVLRVRRGRFFDRDIWPDSGVFRIQRQPFLKPGFAITMQPAAAESPTPLWHCSNRIQDRTHLGARRLEAARGVQDKIHPVALLVIRIRGIDLRDVIRGPERGAVGAVTRRGSVPVRRLPSPIPIPCKIPIPCFVSQFPIKSSVTLGILPVSLWNCSPIEPLKSDYRAKTSEIPSIFPVIWEFDRMRPVRSGMHPSNSPSLLTGAMMSYRSTLRHSSSSHRCKLRRPSGPTAGEERPGRPHLQWGARQ